MHGVKIIRHSLSLQEQGICHLSTVFVLPVMVKGGVRIRLGTYLIFIRIRNEYRNKETHAAIAVSLESAHGSIP